MADVINAVSGNKMFQLKQGIKELRERLKVEEDRLKMQDRGI